MKNNLSRYRVLPLIVLSLTIFVAPAYAQMICPMDDLLGHLPDCVTHHRDMGDIDNRGVYQSLLAKAENAVTLDEQGNTDAAVNLLNAFIHELEAQSGKHINATAANMLIMHAQMAIAQISV